MTGPLKGLRVIEFAGLGPGPFCGMMLADHGAEVIRIDRFGGNALVVDAERDVLNRSRKNITVDLKDDRGIELVRKLCGSADAVLEGFRPGVMERLGLGPDVLLSDNPKLVYGRMTGWGQSGPYAHMAGHDLNYIALSGVLHAVGSKGQKPVPPLNLVGDFGGGGLMLAFGMVAALLHAQRTGEGQVIDCAMTDGSAVLMSMIYSMRAQGRWRDERGSNMFDSGSHYYDVYETADGKFVAVAPVEPQFYKLLLDGLGLADHPAMAGQDDPAQWAAQKDIIAARIRTKSREEWCGVFDGTDACFAPVMSLDEASDHPHNRNRDTFIDVGGVRQPAPAPRYSVSTVSRPTHMAAGAELTAAILREAGFAEDEIAGLRQQRVVG